MNEFHGFVPCRVCLFTSVRMLEHDKLLFYKQNQALGSCDDLLAGFGCSMCLSQFGACMMYANHIQELCSNNMLSCLVACVVARNYAQTVPKAQKYPRQSEITSQCERPERNISPEHVCTCYVLTCFNTGMQKLSL